MFTPEQVIIRLCEAAETLRVLPPPDKPKLAASDWTGFVRGFGEAVQGEEGRFIRDARGRIVHGADQYRTPQTEWHKSFTRPAPPPHGAIDQAFEATSWLRYCRGDRRMVLALWLSYGEGLSVADTARALSKRLKARRVYSRTIVRRWRDAGLALIVEALNAPVTRQCLPA